MKKDKNNNNKDPIPMEVESLPLDQDPQPMDIDTLPLAPSSGPMHVDSHPKLIFSGHRGNGANASQLHLDTKEQIPENTMASFKKAIKSGIDSVEFDLYLSKDGQLMIAHGKGGDMGEIAERVVQPGDSLLTRLGHKPGDRVPLKPKVAAVSQFTKDELQNEFDLSFRTGDNKSKDYDQDYRQMPTFKQLLELASEENAKRAREGKPNLVLNIELKGNGTGEAVDKEINEFNNSPKRGANSPKIENKDLYFLAYNLNQLVDLRERNNDAQLVAGLPTTVSYKTSSKTETGFNISDTDFRAKEVSSYIDKLNDRLTQSHGGAGKPISGVDVFAWDIGDEMIDFFNGTNSKYNIPIHVAVTPVGKDVIENPLSNSIIDNINKITDRQSANLDGKKHPLIMVKTDDFKSLSKTLEKHQGEKQTVNSFEDVTSKALKRIAERRLKTAKDSLVLPKQEGKHVKLLKKPNETQELYKLFGKPSTRDSSQQRAR